jgi:hypothetical protein
MAESRHRQNGACCDADRTEIRAKLELYTAESLSVAELRRRKHEN